MEIRILTAQDNQAFYKIVTELGNELNPPKAAANYQEFLIRLDDMTIKGYFAVGVFIAGELAAVSGIWSFQRFWCGKYFEIDNFIVSKSFRRKGYGEKLIEFIENLARKTGVNYINLATYITNEKSHRFYENAGFIKKGFFMIKKLT